MSILAAVRFVCIYMQKSKTILCKVQTTPANPVLETCNYIIAQASAVQKECPVYTNALNFHEIKENLVIFSVKMIF